MRRQPRLRPVALPRPLCLDANRLTAHNSLHTERHDLNRARRIGIAVGLRVQRMKTRNRIRVPNPHAVRIPARGSVRRPSARAQAAILQRETPCAPLLPVPEILLRSCGLRARALPCVRTRVAGPHPEFPTPTEHPVPPEPARDECATPPPVRTHAADRLRQMPATQNRADRSPAPPTHAAARSPCAHSPRGSSPRLQPQRSRIRPTHEFARRR